MKKILSLAFLCGASFLTVAQTQVPNADFENWTLYKPAYNYYTANGWSNGAACITPQKGTETCTFVNRRTTDAQSGKFAVQHFDVGYDAGPSKGVNALPFYNLDANFSGPAFTGRPTSVSFYYKYSTDDKEPMSLEFNLYSGSLSGNGKIIANAVFEFSNVQSTYKKVDVNFTYLSTDSPTNMYIMSDFTRDGQPKTAFDTLTFDNIVFNYGLPTDVTNPNSPDYFSLVVSNKNIATSKSITNAGIVDLTGRKALSFNQEADNFNVAELKTGIYIFTGTVNNTPFTRKIVIE